VTSHLSLVRITNNMRGLLKVKFSFTVCM
jgi:hypothetical protein